MALLDLFHLLPAFAIEHLEPIITLVVEIDRRSRSNDRFSLFAVPLAKLCAIHPRDALNLILTKMLNKVLCVCVFFPIRVSCRLYSCI